MARDIKFQMMLSPQEAEALDDYQFANRIRSRAEAIRQLVAFAIDQKANEDAAVEDRLEQERRARQRKPRNWKGGAS